MLAQYRRSEVPAPRAAGSFRDFRSKSGTRASHMSEVYSINTADTRLTDAILDFVMAGK
jgi:hypothetical protein